MKPLYGLTSTIMVVGLFAFLYGMYSMSFSIFIEGLFLLWLGFRLTIHAIDNQQLDID